MNNSIAQLAAILTVCVLGSTAQSLESDPYTYQAYLERSTAEATQAWIEIVATSETELSRDAANEEFKFKLALAQFGLLNATMRSKDEDLFNDHVDATVANLEAIKGKHAFEAQALLGAVYGLQLAYSPLKGIYLGPRCSSLLNTATKGDPQSPLIWKLYANSKLYTPKAYGGDIGEAIEAYEKAIALYEATPDKAKSNWIFIDTMAFLGQAYAKDGQNAKAIAMYEKALTAEPNFDWVKYNLLPAAQSNGK
jgi:tetratricopeptide (TPR) repeat protein